MTGTIINYYIHCKRQAFLFYKNIKMEENSEFVKIGKELHKEKLKNNKSNEISIENIKIDKITSEYIIELKKSDSDIKAAKYQLKFYMYILGKKGIIRNGKIEVIEKNNIKKNIVIIYDDNIEFEIENLINEIEDFFIKNQIPIFKEENKCKKCAYYEYCKI